MKAKPKATDAPRQKPMQMKRTRIVYKPFSFTRHTKHRFRKENASERQENALKRKTNRGQSQGIEGQSRAIEHRGLSRAIEGYPGAIPGQSRAIEGNSHTGDADEATDAPRQAYASASNASPCIHEAVKLQSRAIAGAKPGCNA